jgi:hypothetical protein
MLWGIRRSSVAASICFCLLVFSLHVRHQRNSRKWVCWIPITRKHKLINVLKLLHDPAIMKQCRLMSLDRLHRGLQAGWWILCFALGEATCIAGYFTFFPLVFFVAVLASSVHHRTWSSYFCIKLYKVSFLKQNVTRCRSSLGD